MRLGPAPDRRQARAGAIGDDVPWRADEDGPVPHAWVAGDVLDHLGVVIGGQPGFAWAAVRHREPADEVGQPRVCGSLLFGVFVKVVVEFPGLVPDPQVIWV